MVSLITNYRLEDIIARLDQIFNTVIQAVRV